MAKKTLINLETGRTENPNTIYWLLLIFLLMILGVLFSFVLYEKSLADKSCEAIGTENKEGGNCCFIEIDKEILGSNHHAVKCDEMFDYVFGHSEEQDE